MGTAAIGQGLTAARQKRGFYEPFNEYHMCWYPVMLSSALDPREVKSTIANVVSYLHKPGEAMKRQLAGSFPKGNDGLRLFMTISVDLPEDNDATRREIEARLDEHEALHRRIPQEDLAVLNSVEFGKTRLTKDDRDLAEFLAYVRRYPRTTIRKLEAAA